MKIIYYSPHPNLALQSNSGYGTHMREMIAAFERAAHTVKPVIMGGMEEQFDSSAPPTRERKLKDGLKKFVPKKIWYSLKDLQLIWQDRSFEKQLKKEIETFTPDLIYERANYLQPSGVRVANEQGIKHVLEVNSPFVEERESLSGVRSFFSGYAGTIEKELLQKTDHAVVVSSTLRDYLIDEYSVPEEKFTVTPNAISMDKVSVDEQEVERIKRQYDLNGKTVIGFVGSLLPWHGIDLLIKVAYELSDSAIDFKFLIVGDGEEANSLKRMRNDFQVKDRFIFTGRVLHKDIFNYIDAMDITVMPATNWYGSPVKIFEYGAMRKPIIAPDADPVRDVMEDEKDGLLIKAQVSVLKKAIERLTKNEKLKKELAKNFKEKIYRCYTWDCNVERVLNNIDNLK